jgi:hypothetical protein
MKIEDTILILAKPIKIVPQEKQPSMAEVQEGKITFQ